MKAHIDNTIVMPGVSQRSRFRDVFVATAILLLLISARSDAAIGIAATWQANPTSGNSHSNTNWTPPIVPNGISVETISNRSLITDVSLSSSGKVDGIAFFHGRLARLGGSKRRLPGNGERI